MARSALKILAISSVLLMQVSAVSFGQASLVQAGQPSSATQSPENIRLSDTNSEEPHIAVDSQGRVFAGWKQRLGGCLDPNMFARSLDGGRTWSKSPVAFTDTDPGYLRGHSDPWLAVDEFDRVFYVRDEVHFRGAACNGPPNLIMVSRSDDGGLTWGPMVNVGRGRPDMPRIQSDGNGTVYLVYFEGQSADPRAPARYNAVRRSIDGGVTWSTERAAGPANGTGGAVIAARPNGKVFVAWTAPYDLGPGDIMFAASSDRGETWSNPVRVNPQAGSAVISWSYDYPQPRTDPSIVASPGGSLFVAWADRATGDYDILMSRSDDDGATWSAPVRINDTPTGDQWSATLAIDVNNVLHAAWYDQRTGKINLYYANSKDGGQTWSPNLRITTQEFSIRRLGEYFGLAVDRDGAAYMVWTDGRDGGYDDPGPWHIYFARTAGLPRGPVDRPDPVRPSPREGKPRVLPPRN